MIDRRVVTVHGLGHSLPEKEWPAAEGCARGGRRGVRGGRRGRARPLVVSPRICGRAVPPGERIRRVAAIVAAACTAAWLGGCGRSAAPLGSNPTGGDEAGRSQSESPASPETLASLDAGTGEADGDPCGTFRLLDAIPEAVTDWEALGGVRYPFERIRGTDVGFVGRAFRRGRVCVVVAASRPEGAADLFRALSRGQGTEASQRPGPAILARRAPEADQVTKWLSAAGGRLVMVRAFGSSEPSVLDGFVEAVRLDAYAPPGAAPDAAAPCPPSASIVPPDGPEALWGPPDGCLLP